jgi:hypothetical protein
MNKQEYDNKLREIRKKATDEERILAKEYAFSNNPYSINDIIEDHYHIIKITQIGYGFGSILLPACYYAGIELKKDLTPKKNQKNTSMYQGNVKRSIEERK